MVYGVEQLTWIARIIANVASYHYWGGGRSLNLGGSFSFKNNKKNRNLLWE